MLKMERMYRMMRHTRFCGLARFSSDDETSRRESNGMVYGRQFALFIRKCVFLISWPPAHIEFLASYFAYERSSRVEMETFCTALERLRVNYVVSDDTAIPFHYAPLEAGGR